MKKNNTKDKKEEEWKHPFPKTVKCKSCGTVSPAMTYTKKHAYYKCPNSSCPELYFIGWDLGGVNE